VLAYILEGHLMFTEGLPAAMIEQAGKQAGMPVGPLSLNDEVGVDLGLKILRATKAQLGETAIVPDQEELLTALVEKEGRLGRKNRKGFYDYPEGGQKRLWLGLRELQTKQVEPELVDMQELKARLLVTQALEAARTFEEGVITDPREADVGSILGFGFAPYTGGALSYIDFMGAKAFVDLCKGLQSKHGDRFAPPRILLDMASSGETFYGRAAGAKKAA
jgi:3-hydroxyacyl-CoA dehydrogenase/enoyl-CoA hydratase/3-hydroxybutyryl-CoA epimerase